jgi:hypothetical protein
MSKLNGREIYLKIKKGGVKYKEEVHCPLVIDVMNNEGTMSDFCRKIGISDREFYRWALRHPIFDKCYQVGKMISKSNWEEEGRKGKGDPNFNLEHWRITGSSRYGIGKTNRIRVNIDHNANPFIQYQQLIQQANGEDFTASELKQLMECINVGVRAYESFKIQEEVNKMKDDLSRMRVNGDNIIPIKNA